MSQTIQVLMLQQTAFFC